MTRDEAIEVLKVYRDKLTNSASNQLDGDIKAFDMAISALEQEPCIDKFSREYHEIYMSGWNDGRKKLLQAMEKEIAI